MAVKKVLRETQSICPYCLKVLDAIVYADENNVVRIRRECPEHGVIDEVYTFADLELYEWADKYWHDGDGIENPRTKTVKGCPFDCGLCPNHKSHTVLGIIDVTNRCNLRCPVCFARADVAGYVYEPTLEQIRKMMENLRNNRPVPCPAIQLSGGEPTVRDDLPEIVKMGKEVGFRHVEVDTNGIRVAKDIKFYEALLDAGMSTMYLQFDGLSDEIYRQTRGVPLLKIKKKVIENAREIGHESIVLVVTLVRGVNDKELGRIIDFAIKNSDVVRCVNVQPLSFAGSATEMERKKYRINTSDFMKLVEEQTNGRVSRYDFRPVPSVVPISRAIGALKDTRYVEFTTAPFCGVATFLVQDSSGEWKPITRMANVDKFFKSMEKVYDDAKKGKKLRAKIRAFLALRHVKFGLLRRFVWPVIKEGSYEKLGKLMMKFIMIGCMHFMDVWNYDLQRVQRCVIHYSLPDGTIRSFCTYNNFYREEIEKKFSVPYEEWLKAHKPTPIYKGS